MRVFHVRDDFSRFGICRGGQRVRFGAFIRLAEIKTVGSDVARASTATASTAGTAAIATAAGVAR